MRWVFIGFVLILALCPLAMAQTADTRALQDINTRIEQSKAETIKAIQDNQAKTEAATQKSIDDNFGVLDNRIQTFFKDSKRDFAIVVLGALVVGYVLAQIIRIQIEQGRRKATVKRMLELEEHMARMEQDAMRLTAICNN